ncbi:MAG: quercetin 2,3-dioxygenase [Gallionellales bacterium RIFCSPLOWO2_12_FULL_59_22]|nr:MAG: quercetin 2,3-dioxygenase [Gallionellales bacterium RIFCSPLOWO2_02_FULL_59_110]OGT05442.1 MAG: quercetin 2,3-dioxygenase [Gallionellales bacterium RIFCSPLOWO2_02_58_13]OGT12076.1 MAG: quercetin 2,3-dioxygenase [Gallionellales bacterium RIFCSPLOWO2_12_FULL_59_22]
MITQRKAAARGHANHGWLESWHSFSFADYQDPAQVRFGALRVINEDIVRPGTGFDTHGHRDMEIVTYILSGRLRHRDSMGNGEDIHTGEIQLMRAGSGVQHSEFNPSPDEPVHLLQIWIMPDEQGLAPGYWQKIFTDETKRGRWCLLVSPDAADGSLRIRQDARLSVALLDGAETLNYPIPAGRKAYLHVARGSLRANGHELNAGDALKYVGEELVSLAAGSKAEVLLFDLA